MDYRIRLLMAVTLLATGAVALSAQAMRNVPRVSVDELRTLMDKKAVVIVDVRDPGQFNEGRIPGAINIDYTEMMAKGARFKGEPRTIVTYCACVNETTAARAALDLAALGIPGAKALKGGWQEWVDRNLPVEK
jgi:3-mercaptopyruvate sulfurtransferase SseA